MKKFLYVVLLIIGVSCTDRNTPSSPLDDGVLKGTFSVSDNLTVRFSKGNLQYCDSSKTWHFAEQQYIALREKNSLKSDENGGWMDLFGWGTGDHPCLSSTENADYLQFSDWGANPIANGGNTTGLWRTLSGDEWTYLLQERNRAKDLFALVSIFGGVTPIEGFLILPDSWQDLENIPLKKGGHGSWKDNELSYQEWLSIQSAGAVLLPAGTGRRWGDFFLEGGTGYWTSSKARNGGALYVNLSPNRDPMVTTAVYNDVPSRFQGLAVRLVRDVK